jgi:hypothetical protein
MNLPIEIIKNVHNTLVNTIPVCGVGCDQIPYEVNADIDIKISYECLYKVLW